MKRMATIQRIEGTIEILAIATTSKVADWVQENIAEVRKVFRADKGANMKMLKQVEENRSLQDEREPVDRHSCLVTGAKNFRDKSQAPTLGRRKIQPPPSWRRGRRNKSPNS